MLLRKRSDPNVLRVGDKVVAVKPIGAIPEGTRGRIKVADGFGWIRYWVAWETGEWMGSVDAASVVGADRLDAYRTAQAAALAQAATRAAQPAGAAAAGDAAGEEGGAGGGAAPAGDGRVPEHLLERARLARERKAAQAAG
jgi:hypothetical protein